MKAMTKAKKAAAAAPKAMNTTTKMAKRFSCPLKRAVAASKAAIKRMQAQKAKLEVEIAAELEHVACWEDCLRACREVEEKLKAKKAPAPAPVQLAMKAMK